MVREMTRRRFGGYEKDNHVLFAVMRGRKPRDDYASCETAELNEL